MAEWQFPHLGDPAAGRNNLQGGRSILHVEVLGRSGHQSPTRLGAGPAEAALTTWAQEGAPRSLAVGA